MNISWAVLIGSALIAASVVVTNHWEVVAMNGDPVMVGRLNRWTGSLELCVSDLSTVKGANVLRGVRMVCPSQ
jgi:hypothetical protein